MAITVPNSIKSVTALYRRTPVLGHALLVIRILSVLLASYWCLVTLGEPLAAAEALLKTKRSAAIEDAWDNFGADDDSDVGDFIGTKAAKVAKKAATAAVKKVADAASSTTTTATGSETNPGHVPMPAWWLPNFWAGLALVAALLICLLVWFIQRWSIKAKSRLQYTPAPSLGAGTYAFVTPHIHQGIAAIVPVEAKTIGGVQVWSFEFQRQRFELDIDAQVIHEQSFPIKLPLSSYTRATGLTSADTVQEAIERFGKNTLHIPTPSFFQLFSEQILSPVPVFQVLPTVFLTFKQILMNDEYDTYINRCFVPVYGY
jgi:hypothetical protein